MKKALNANTAAGIVIAACLFILVGGWWKYLKEPPKLSPEQMRENMGRGMGQDSQARTDRIRQDRIAHGLDPDGGQTQAPVGQAEKAAPKKSDAPK